MKRDLYDALVVFVVVSLLSICLVKWFNAYVGGIAALGDQGSPAERK